MASSRSRLERDERPPSSTSLEGNRALQGTKEDILSCSQTWKDTLGGGVAAKIGALSPVKKLHQPGGLEVRGNVDEQ